jgi:hypothetical protein
MFKLIIIVLLVAAIVGFAFSMVRKITTKSAPIALGVAIVLAVFINPVMCAHALMCAVVVGLFYIVFA